jgi:uncharacterized spore protein YtfJ
MSGEGSDAWERARQTAEGGKVDSLIEGLAERIGAQAGVRAVFGEPLERGDKTVVPVARARWGFGGGAGQGPEEQGSGTGGGGGATADPIGYLLVSSEGARFEPIAQPVRVTPGLVLAATAGGALILWAFARLVRG